MSERRDAIYQLHSSGLVPVASLAIAFGVTPQRISQLARMDGAPDRRVRPIVGERLDRLLKMYDSGERLSTIAARLGVSKNRVVSTAVAHGRARRQPERARVQ